MPGELIAPQNAGQRFERERSGEDRGGSEGLLRAQAQRRERAGVQLHLGGGFILIGREEAIKETEQQKAGLNGGDETPAAAQSLPEIPQRRRCGREV